MHHTVVRFVLREQLTPQQLQSDIVNSKQLLSMELTSEQIRLWMMHERTSGSNATVASERINVVWGEDTVGKTAEVDEPCPPCGICRQFLDEFGDYKVISGSSIKEEILCTSTLSMLPHAFTPALLEKHTVEYHES
ncbi:hypothetical protein KIN20_022001 [Parelaphostrongylus tenuis]|uniref:Cytidine deaminase n=1 Tax=Parelaphostrongylus tenuis TaxID=148309 RepID=A0AAD5QWI9_PARTN|nr:hypothetical protein KIN20_022001 [Parelaphostrongylus tenuis]